MINCLGTKLPWPRLKDETVSLTLGVQPVGIPSSTLTISILGEFSATNQGTGCGVFGSGMICCSAFGNVFMKLGTAGMGIVSTGVLLIVELLHVLQTVIAE